MNPQALDTEVQRMLGTSPAVKFPTPDGLLALSDSRIAFASTDESRTPPVSLATDQIAKHWYREPVSGQTEGVLHVRTADNKDWEIRIAPSDAPQAVRRIADYSGVDPATEDQSGFNK